MAARWYDPDLWGDEPTPPQDEFALCIDQFPFLVAFSPTNMFKKGPALSLVLRLSFSFRFSAFFWGTDSTCNPGLGLGFTRGLMPLLWLGAHDGGFPGFFRLGLGVELAFTGSRDNPNLGLGGQ